MKNTKSGLYNPKTCIKISILVNILLTGFKFIAGVFGLSKAMLADAFHSLSDILTSVVVYIGVHIGSKPPDEDHPYGHGNAETIAASIVSLVILGMGGFAAIESIQIIASGHFLHPRNIALVAAVVSIAVKEGLYRYAIKVGEMTNNPALVADAWHHRSDAISSVAALIGIAGARISFHILDPLAALVVSVLIAKIGFDLMRANVGIIMDERPQTEFIKKIGDIVRQIEGVCAVDDVKVHRRGSTFTIDLEISVDSKITVSEGHKIASHVRTSIFRKIKNVRDVMVHVNPSRTKPRT